MKTFLRLLFICLLILAMTYTSCGVVTDAPYPPQSADAMLPVNTGAPESTQSPAFSDNQSQPTPTPAVTATPGNPNETPDMSTQQSAEPTPTTEPSNESPPLLPDEPAEEPVIPQTTDYSPPPLELPSNVTSPYRNSYPSPYNEDGTLRNDRQPAGFKPNDNHQPPVAHTGFDIRQFGGYYLGDISKPVVYLTMDVGYENGYTAGIMDTLKEKGVQVTFFVTKSYITRNPELTKRMIEEGHIVGNHTVNHLMSYDQTDEEFAKELTDTAKAFKDTVGIEMSKYFRFPEGEYSARTLNLAYGLGYKSIFWSLAYDDYNERGRQYAYDYVIGHVHNGCIILLHAISESNAQALADIIDAVRSMGYEFKSLDELP